MSANTSEPSRPARHGPCRFQRYVEIHETIMERFRGTHFVGADTLTFLQLGRRLMLCGEIGCKGRIVIGVAKELEYVEDATSADDPLIQTVRYSYNVSVQSSGIVFRYDNQHEREGHADRHHKHVFNWPDVEEPSGSPVWIGAAQWPTLQEVIAEAMAWHANNYDRLVQPESFPNQLQSGLRF